MYLNTISKNLGKIGIKAIKVVDAMTKALKCFEKANPSKVRLITVVVYKDTQVDIFRKILPPLRTYF